MRGNVGVANLSSNILRSTLHANAALNPAMRLLFQAKAANSFGTDSIHTYPNNLPYRNTARMAEGFVEQPRVLAIQLLA
jgi:hypothetical protein